MPVEHRRSGCVINNYYVSGDNRETLSLLISSVLEAIGKKYVCLPLLWSTIRLYLRNTGL